MKTYRALVRVQTRGRTNYVKTEVRAESQEDARWLLWAQYGFHSIYSGLVLTCYELRHLCRTKRAVVFSSDDISVPPPPIPFWLAFAGAAAAGAVAGIGWRYG